MIIVGAATVVNECGMTGTDADTARGRRTKNINGLGYLPPSRNLNFVRELLSPLSLHGRLVLKVW